MEVDIRKHHAFTLLKARVNALLYTEHVDLLRWVKHVKISKKGTFSYV